MFYDKLHVWLSSCFDFQMNVYLIYDLIDYNAATVIEKQYFFTDIR